MISSYDVQSKPQVWLLGQRFRVTRMQSLVIVCSSMAQSSHIPAMLGITTYTNHPNINHSTWVSICFVDKMCMSTMCFCELPRKKWTATLASMRTNCCPPSCGGDGDLKTKISWSITTLTFLELSLAQVTSHVEQKICFPHVYVDIGLRI